MSTIQTPEAPIVKPLIDKETLVQLLHDELTESQVIVHCSYRPFHNHDKIRIWKSTYLFDNNSDHKSNFVSSENISLYPNWTWVEANKTHIFTLIFTGLPKSCESFDLIESIPEPGGFEVRNIRRNKSDVYYLKLK